MIVLGLHKDPWHNSGAAMIRNDGDTPRIVMISEERLDRIKDSRSFPEKAVGSCMRQLGVSSYEDLDLVVLDYIRNGNDWRADHYRRPCRNDVFLNSIPAERIKIVNHHLAHACSVFYSSPFEEAAILIVDGRGSDNETQSLYMGTRDGIDPLAKTDKIGIGLLYAAVTQLIGFGLLQEGKTMGLAPYGEFVSKQIFTFPKKYDGICTDYSDFCIEDSYDIQAEHQPVVSFDDKARAAYEVQQECEDAMMHLVRYARETTNARNLCISGGVGLNSVANYKILSSKIFDDVFINPASSDTGIPLGAALHGYHHILRQEKNYKDIPAFIGPQYTPAEVETAIGAHNGYVIERNNAKREAVELLVANKIVACFQGRSEMGPRALGNRSILMSPLRAENKDILNKRVKHREAFRPFAPVVLEQFTSEYFEIDRPSPHMLFVPYVKPDKRTTIPAVTHVDGTGRLQTVTSEQNPVLCHLISSFGDVTGVPVLLNTSFNDNGEPIVESPEDAVRCFLATNIDALLINDILLKK